MITVLATVLLVLQGSPLTLDEALARAKHHPRLAQARAAVRQQERRIEGAEAAYYPTINGTLGYSQATSNVAPGPGARVPGGTPDPSNDSFGFLNTSLNANQLVWDFGRAKAGVSAVESQRDAVIADQSTVEADLGLSVRVSYFSVLAAEALARSAGANTTTQEKHLASIQAQFEVGRRPPYDLTRARIDVGNARLLQLQQDNVVLSVRADLSQAVGEDVSKAPLVRPATPETADPDLETALQKAISARPELAAQDARILAQRAALEAAKAAYWPSIGVNGQFSERGASFPLVYNWSLGASISVPILAGGADVARIAEQSATLDGLQEARAVLLLGYRSEIEKQVIAVAEAKARITLTSQVVEQTLEGVRLAEGRYDAGVGNIIELADAQAQAVAAEANGIKAEFDLALARARLRRAMGEP